jgi:AcrR family transcriptional regulator
LACGYLALRAGVEGTIRQTAHTTGLRRARYRGLAKTHLDHTASATGTGSARQHCQRIVRLRFSRPRPSLLVRNRSVPNGVQMPPPSDDATIRRPRMTPEREVELLSATVDILGEVSYDELSMDLVATRARCSKATLYRLWPGKAQLVAAALYATRPMRPEEIDTGTLRGDLMAMVELLGPHAEKDASLFAALGHAVLTDEQLAEAVRTTLLEPWFADLTGVVDRAVERGELSHRPSATDLLPQILVSLMLTRPMIERLPADIDYLTRCVDHSLLPALLHT